jgi:hypothetical protein
MRVRCNPLAPAIGGQQQRKMASTRRYYATGQKRSAMWR